MADYPFLQTPSAIHDKNYPYMSSISAPARHLLAHLIALLQYAKNPNDPQLDKEGIPYVTFSLNQVMQYIGCRKDKACSLMQELRSAGYIRTVPQGQGKPSRIYIADLDLGSIKREIKDSIAVPAAIEVRRILETNIQMSDFGSATDPKLVANIINVIVNITQSEDITFVISGFTYDANYVRQMLLTTTATNIAYVIQRLRTAKQTIYAPQNYILARLWDSYTVPDICATGSSQKIPQNPSGQLGDAELDAIQQVMAT